MPGPVMSPEDWARAAAGWTDQFFGIRVSQEDDPDRLRAAAAYEAERTGETRPERIARLNKRLKKVTE